METSHAITLMGFHFRVACVDRNSLWIFQNPGSQQSLFTRKKCIHKQENKPREIVVERNKTNMEVSAENLFSSIYKCW